MSTVPKESDCTSWYKLLLYTDQVEPQLLIVWEYTVSPAEDFGVLPANPSGNQCLSYLPMVSAMVSAMVAGSSPPTATDQFPSRWNGFLASTASSQYPIPTWATKSREKNWHFKWAFGLTAFWKLFLKFLKKLTAKHWWLHFMCYPKPPGRSPPMTFMGFTWFHQLPTVPLTKNPYGMDFGTERRFRNEETWQQHVYFIQI